LCARWSAAATSCGLSTRSASRVRRFGGLYNGATTKELDLLSIQTAASLIAEEPEYSRLAARLLDGFIAKEVANQDIHSVSQSIVTGKHTGSSRRI